MKPKGPTDGSAEVCCAMSGVECWLVKAQFLGVLFCCQHILPSQKVNHGSESYQSLG